MWREFGVYAGQHLPPTSSVVHPSDNNQRLHFLADVPHVIKNLRSAFLKHKTLRMSISHQQDFDLPTSTIDIAHVQDLLDYQESKSLKLAPKLSNSVLDPSHFEKMKVGLALNLFSHSVSAALTYLVEKEDRPASYITTAWFVGSCNRWYDLMTSRHPVMALSKVNAANFEQAVTFLQKFADVISSLDIGGQWKPSQTGVQLSTASILNLAEDLLNEQPYFLTSRVTQDCLENLFSCVRYKNPNPTAREFKSALKAISIAQYFKPSKHGSYEEDDRQFLGSLLPADVNVAIDENSCPDSEFSFNQFERSISSDEEAALYYIAGYCMQSLVKLNQVCQQCVQPLLATSLEEHSRLVDLKDYTGQSLCRVSGQLYAIFRCWEHGIRSNEQYIHDSGFKKKMLKLCQLATATQCAELSVPACHPIISRLLTKFLVLRIRGTCKKLQSAHRDQSVPFGSKSTAMRHMVQKL